MKMKKFISFTFFHIYRNGQIFIFKSDLKRQTYIYILITTKSG